MAGALLGPVLGLGIVLNTHAQSPVDQAIGEQSGAQREAADTQQRIDQLDDQTRMALDQYRETLRHIDQLRNYNAQMERMIATQQAETSSLEQQINSIEVTKRQMLPLMRQMLDVLGQLVQADTPFLLEERSTRISELEAMMQQAGTSLAEKFRRIMEAYQIELEYGNTIEAYRAALPHSSDSRTVELLRIGRTELYYLTLDGQEAGVWNKDSRSWQVLPQNNVQMIRQGLRLARKELPPDLIRLPVAAPEVAR
jgi:septal ring factor EnvC (AmiA/AmiB activator)